VSSVRARWRRLVLLRATARAGLTVGGVLAVTFVLAFWVVRLPLVLGGVGFVGMVLAALALVWSFWPARELPSDTRTARFIEERDPSFDDGLVTAVAMLEAGQQDTQLFGASLLADTGRRASAADVNRIVSGEAIRRAGFQAVAAALLVAGVAFVGRDAARKSFDALSFSLFPSRVALEVTPGHARIRAGQPLTIEARLVGSNAPVAAQVWRAAAANPDVAVEDDWRPSEMTTGAAGAFTFSVDAVDAPFRYRVIAGAVSSPIYEVTVARVPRVARIDVDYTYPSALGLEPRTDEDSGDIYAPAGTDVRLRIYTDGDATAGRMDFTGGNVIDLEPGSGVFSGSLTVLADTSYRVALRDMDGVASPGDTEYFVRILDDRPPDVRVLRPARDRDVTALDEVDIVAEAHDDFGLERFELVYSVNGGPEVAVPLETPQRATSVEAGLTLYLEDLEVVRGDFVSYYVRARDIARGARSSEARSDIFFLQVRPFDQEFKLVDSSGMGGANDKQVDDLVTAQKQIIVATWKLDRRAETAGSSEQDIRAVARAESELKKRVEETASSFRTSTMRDPRRPQGRGEAAPVLRAGQTTPEEQAMLSAAEAMGRAAASLDRLQTDRALPDEMEALNRLLEAQANLKEQEVPRQQAGNGGGNRTTQDLSGLFDRELQRDQQTNYETPPPPEERGSEAGNTLDRVKDLAERQAGLLRRQQELGREQDQMSEADLEREIDQLTKEQTELRQRAEQMAQQMGAKQAQSGEQGQQKPQQGGEPGQQGQSGQSGQAQGQQSGPGQGQSNPQGQPGQPGQQAGQQGQSSQQGQGTGGGEQMRAASQEMQAAASDLQRRDAAQAATRSGRALEQLRQVESQLRTSTPDEQRRALGEMQLEARQLADAQRQVGSELDGAAGEAARDAMRRMAGEQDRLAERARRLRDDLQRQGTGAPAGANDQAAARDVQRAAGEVAREIDRQRLVERMEQSADEMRAAGDAAPESGPTQPGGATPRPSARAPEDVARALEKLADRLALAGGSPDAESKKLAEQLARAQELRDRIENSTRELERLDQEATKAGASGERASAGTNDLAALRDELNRQLQETQQLLQQVQKEDPSFTPGDGAGGLTFEGGGKMVLSAPGTEAFKQDFERWEELRAQATQALARAGSSLSTRLNARESRDRLASGVDERVPAEYQEQVDSYFKALASKKTP
jgi:hypothetical protein